jgi:TIR domain
MSAQPSQTLEVFFSYAHRDEALRVELVKHLSLLQRQGVITTWHDRKITAGTEWAGAIDAHLQSAQIILLLVSADFMASDYWVVQEDSNVAKLASHPYLLVHSLPQEDHHDSEDASSGEIYSILVPESTGCAVQALGGGQDCTSSLDG